MFEEKCLKIACDLIGLLEIDCENMAESEKELIVAFYFGMVNILAGEMEKDIAEVAKAMLKILVYNFKFFDEPAQQFLQFLFNSTRREFNPVFNAIIRQGADGYFDYDDGHFDELKTNITMLRDLALNGE